MSKLTIEDVRTIRKIGKKMSLGKLAVKFNVTRTAIFKVLKRQTKKNLRDKQCPTCGQ
jgi:predicted DNA-binding protein YlxM (UPF0122 family)